MEPDGFDEYQCTEPVNINLDTEEFLNVLKRGKTDDSLVLMVDGGNLVITFEGGARKTFKIRLIDLEYESPSPPDLEFPAKIELPFKLFKDAIKDSSLFSDKMRLNINESKFTASSEGDFGDFNMEYLHGENVDCEVSSIYGLDYLNEMVRSDKLSDNVKLELGIDMHLSLKLESEEYKSVLSFILAPRIEAEE
jgi:proliferating cell nuclear antigen